LPPQNTNLILVLILLHLWLPTLSFWITNTHKKRPLKCIPLISIHLSTLISAKSIVNNRRRHMMKRRTIGQNTYGLSQPDDEVVHFLHFFYVQKGWTCSMHLCVDFDIEIKTTSFIMFLQYYLCLVL
jgi:hypothetical protein